MKAKQFFVGFLVFAVCTLLLVGQCFSAEEKIFKFGHIDGFSGEAASWAMMSQQSMEIAAEDINARGGIKVKGEGYKVEIVKYDHAWDPSIAFTLAKKAIYDDGIRYIHTDSDEEVFAMIDVCNKNKVILMPIIGSLEAISEKYPYTWNHYPLPSDTIGLMMEYSKKAHPEYRKIAGIYPDSASGYLNDKELRKCASDLGWEVVDVKLVPHGATDFYGLLIPLLKKEIHSIELGLTPPGQQGLIIKQARELGYKGIFMHSDTLEIPILEPMTGMKALEGCLASPKFLEFNTETGKKWRERFLKRVGSMEGWAAWEYDFFMLMAAAIEKANTFDTEEVNKVMAEVEVEGIFGPTRYKSKDERFIESKMGVVEVINGKQVQVMLEYPRRMRH